LTDSMIFTGCLINLYNLHEGDGGRSRNQM
jgi:hypothetical protein